MWGSLREQVRGFRRRADERRRARARRAILRRERLEEQIRQQRGCLTARKRRQRRLAELTPLQRQRLELREQRRAQRRQREMSGCRGVFCSIGARVHEQDGSVSKGALLIVGLLLVVFLFSLLLPAIALYAIFGWVASFLIKLPGAQQALKVYTTITCNGVSKALQKGVGGVLGFVKSVTGFGTKIISAPFKFGGKLLSASLHGVGSAAGVLPVIGDPAKTAINKTGDAAGWVVSAGGYAIASPVYAIEFGAKLADLGATALKELQRAVCELDQRMELFKEMHLEDPFRKALDCSLWNEDAYGPLTKEAKKWCLDGKKRGDRPGQVPEWLVPIYQAAGQRYHVPWEVLAAINWNDTEYGSKPATTQDLTARVKAGLLGDISKKADKDKLAAMQAVSAEWQSKNKQVHDRVGWIPFDHDEWVKYGVDYGSVPPSYAGNPYEDSYCPSPIDVKSNVIGGLGGGGITTAGGNGKDNYTIPPYPGDKASRKAIAQWMAASAQSAGLPPELPVMATLVETGGQVKNLDYGDASSTGFFQMLASWNTGKYAGFLQKPQLQMQWFLDYALKERDLHPELLRSQSTWGEFIANVERPAEQYRGRYQLQLNNARELIGGASVPTFSNPAEVAISFEPDHKRDVCDPVDSIFALARYLADHGAAGDTWAEADYLIGDANQIGIDDTVSGPIASRIVEIAKQELAKSPQEQPMGSNNGPDVARYNTATPGVGLPNPWCAMFTSWVARRAGVPVGPDGRGDAGAWNTYHWAESQNIAHKTDPQAGDLVVFSWGTGHIGVVVAVKGDKIFTIEGNTGSGVVARQTRSATAEVMGYVRLAELKGQQGGGDGEDVADDGKFSAGNRDAQGYAKDRDGAVSYAVADDDGKIIASYRKDAPVNSASLSKAMIMAAVLQSDPTGEQRALLDAMITRSDNVAANTLFKQVGEAAIDDIADDARMQNFDLVQKLQGGSSGAYILGYSQLTAADQARFFARIFKIIPQRNVDYAKQLLSGVTEGRWGVFNLGNGTAYGKSGWRPEDNGGWTVNNAGQYNGKGYAVLTEGSSDEEYGIQSLNGVYSRLADGGWSNDISTDRPEDEIKAPPITFNAKAVPPVDQMTVPNDKLDRDKDWVQISKQGHPFPSFDSALEDPSGLEASSCSETAVPSSEQQQVFKAAASAFGVQWEAVASLVKLRSGYGCDFAGNWAYLDERYLTDADGDQRASRSDLVDIAFSVARNLRTLGAEPEESKKAAVSLLKKDKSLIAQFEYSMKTLGAKGYDDMDAIEDSPIGQAIASRDHAIDENVCPDAESYVKCIAKLYRKIKKTDPNRDDTDKGSAGDALTGGCNPDPVPDFSVKPQTDNAYETNKARQGLNVTGGETQGRAAAIKATVAVIEQMQACNSDLKKNWQRIQVNDWNDDGHGSHKNGADNDFTITNVTAFGIPAGSTSYNRKQAIQLGRMFLRAGAVEIYFADPKVRHALADERETLLKNHPNISERMGPRWRNHPMGDAYNFVGGEPGLDSTDTVHANHFHVRWYPGAANADPPDVKVWLGGGDDRSSASSCQDANKPADGPYANLSGDSASCSTGAEKRVLLLGDSLAHGIESILPGMLDGWKVTTDTEDGRPMRVGMERLRSKDVKGQVLAVSLFTNDSPNDISALKASVSTALNAVGDNGCVVWSTIHRPPVGGVSYAAANKALNQMAAKDPKHLRIVQWADAVSKHPQWVASDPLHVHPTFDGYKERARMFAQAAKSCV